MDQVAWLQNLLRKRGISAPDGRPLFGYHLTDDELPTLEKLVREMLGELERTDRNNFRRFQPLLCLYAAETFRREHVEGPWTWTTVFDPLGVAQPNPQTLRLWIEAGLKWWRRPLIQGQDGTRFFLVTIACEGGLPLRLLRHQSARLRGFFIELLEEYHHAGCLGEADAQARARRLAHRLPGTLRQDVVFQLGGKLVSSVVALWQQIGDVLDPITALQVQVPDWRLQLPLSADDATVTALLAPLMSRVTGLARAATARLSWRGLLREARPGTWTIEKELSLAETLDEAVLRQWLNRPHDQVLPVRLRLLLCDETGSEAVAWLTRGGARALYRREWLRRDGLRIEGAALLAPHELLLDDGQSRTPLRARFEEPWTEGLPWVFVDKGGTKAWHSHGSARTCSSEAWVAAPMSLLPEVSSSENCRSVGQIPGLGLHVFQVQGTTLFACKQGDVFQVTCGAADETDELFRVHGVTLPEVWGPRPIYRGLPAIHSEDADGHRRPVNGRCEWRAVGGNSPWRRDAAAAGLVWLRFLDAQGAERYRRQVAVVPRDFHIERAIAQGKRCGSYRFSGLQGGQLSVRPLEGVVIDPTETGQDQAAVSCPALAGTSLPLLDLKVHWSGAPPVHLSLPYPQRGAAFLMGNRILPPGAAVPLERCGGLRLVVMDPDSKGHFNLEGELVGTHFGFRTRLPFLHDGRLDTSLHAWQERLSALLASSGDLDTEVRLAVTRNQERLARVRVTRFDCLLVPGPQRERIQVKTDSPDRDDPDWQERLSLAALRLWDPAGADRPLEPCPDEPMCWLVPDDLDPGPWLVMGRERDWVRFRPLLWSVPAHEGGAQDAVSPLADAIREPDHEARKQRLAEVLAALAPDPEHADWVRLFAYIELTRELSPNALDVLRQLAIQPRTLAMSLLRAGEDAFERVWALAEDLPFLWWLLPIEDWLAAAIDYFASVQEALGDADPHGELLFSVLAGFRVRIQSRHPAFGSLCDWLQERLMPSKPLEQIMFEAFRARPALSAALISAEEAGLQERHSADEIWPIGTEVLDRAKSMAFSQFQFKGMGEPFRAVRCAPFVAADVAINGRAYDSRLILELRLIRAFDQHWFDMAYAHAVTLGLAALPPQE